MLYVLGREVARRTRSREGHHYLLIYTPFLDLDIQS